MAKEKLILNKEDFEFVQMNEKIFDKKFETKAIGYFGDAFRRFCKNKSSVVAFIMLMFIILIFGDSTDRHVTFQKPLSELLGKSARLRFKMKDAYLYSFVI